MAPTSQGSLTPLSPGWRRALSWLAPVVLIAAPAVANADQCSAMTREHAQAAAATLVHGATVYEWCEPCQAMEPWMPRPIPDPERVASVAVAFDPNVGLWRLLVNGVARDAAYLFVVPSGSKWGWNVAMLAGCPARRVSEWVDPSSGWWPKVGR